MGAPLRNRIQLWADANNYCSSMVSPHGFVKLSSVIKLLACNVHPNKLAGGLLEKKREIDRSDTVRAIFAKRA
jgi:uncharacterized protein YccT (UPF0319 family)